MTEVVVSHGVVVEEEAMTGPTGVELGGGGGG
jgi:hypothetical protein